MDCFTRINPTLQEAISFCLIYAKMQQQNSIRVAPLELSSQPPLPWWHSAALLLYSSLCLLHSLSYLQLLPFYYFLIAAYLAVRAESMSFCLVWPAADSQLVCCILLKQETPNNDTGLSISDQFLLAAFPLLLILLLQWDCLWFGLPKPLYQVFVQLWCLAAGTRRWTTGSAVLGRLLAPQVCWFVGQGLSTAAPALPCARAAAGAIKPVKLTQHTLRKSTKGIISTIS